MFIAAIARAAFALILLVDGEPIALITHALAAGTALLIAAVVIWLNLPG